MIQVYLESIPCSSRALSVLSVLYRSFGKALLKSALAQTRKKQNAGLFQHIADKTKRVLLSACASVKKSRLVYSSSGLAMTEGGGEISLSQTNSEEHARRRLSGGRSVVAAACAVLAWEKEMRQVDKKCNVRSFEGEPLQLSLPFPPLIVWPDGAASARPPGFEGLVDCVESGPPDMLTIQQTLSGPNKTQKDARIGALFYACWAETQQFLARRALDILDVCIASRKIPQTQAASAAHSVGLTLLTHVFKTEQQVAAFFGTELSSSASEFFSTYQCSWAGSVASQVLNVALNEWATSHSSRQQHLDSAFFRFYAERRPDFLKYLDFLGTAEWRARSAYVRRECVAIAAAVACHPSFLDATGGLSSKGREGENDDERIRQNHDSVGAQSTVPAPVVRVCWKAWVHRAKRGGRRAKSSKPEAEEDPVCPLVEPLPVRQEVSASTSLELLRQMASLAETATSPDSRASFSSASQMKASHKEMLTALKSVLQTTCARITVEGNQRGSGGSVRQAGPFRGEQGQEGRDKSERPHHVRAAAHDVGERVKDAALKLRGSARRHEGICSSIMRLVRLLQGNGEYVARADGGSKKQKKRKRDEQRHVTT